MTGFGVSATLGLPDSGLISVGEMVQAGSVICDNLPNMPCIGDGDTVSLFIIVLVIITCLYPCLYSLSY